MKQRTRELLVCLFALFVSGLMSFAVVILTGDRLPVDPARSWLALTFFFSGLSLSGVAFLSLVNRYRPTPLITGVVGLFFTTISLAF